MLKRIIISGCSGGGKSSLLAELHERGSRVFTEPGRQVVEEEIALGGSALPWKDEREFAKRVIAVAVKQWETAKADTCFYDRAIIDAVTWFERQEQSVPQAITDLVARYRYFHTVILAPPWPEIFITDDARRHTLADAISEYQALLASYPAKGYDVVILPKMGIAERADWLLDRVKEW